MRQVHLKHILLIGAVLYVVGLGFFVLPRTDRHTSDLEWDHHDQRLQRRISRVARLLARNLTVLAQLETSLLTGEIDEMSRAEISDITRLGPRVRDRKGGERSEGRDTKPQPWDDPESLGESEHTMYR